MLTNDEALPRMPTIITFTSLEAPVRTRIRRRGYHLPHRCEDVAGVVHRQRLPLGSIRGITHLDALCVHCGAHFVWVEDHHTPARPNARAKKPGTRTVTHDGVDEI